MAIAKPMYIKLQSTQHYGQTYGCFQKRTNLQEGTYIKVSARDEISSKNEAVSACDLGDRFGNM
jgi:hypothetical protein